MTRRRGEAQPQIPGLEGEEENLKKVVDIVGGRAKAKASAAPLKIKGEVEHLIDLAGPLEKEANAAGIYNVFDDGGYRTLLMLTMFGLSKPPGRLGDDAHDAHGRTYELKTINLINTKGELRTSYPGVTTEHTLRQENVDRYRACDSWLIGVFKGNQPLDVWVVPSEKLEPFYQEWEQKIAKAPNREINNPKIPMGFIAEVGTKHSVPGSEDVPRPQNGRKYKPRK